MRSFTRIHWPSYSGNDHTMGISRTLSTTICILAILGIIGALLWLIIPQLIESIRVISQQIPSNMTSASDWINATFSNLPALGKQADLVLNKLAERLVTWLETSVIPGSDKIMEGISTGIINLARGIFNFIVGLIICAFFINRKEVFLAQCKKLVMALFRKDIGESILRGASFTNQTFLQFIIGKLIDSLIVGILCFLCMVIFGWPYAALISVIIGVCNIIPFFGPFIGAIPSALLMLMESPKLCLLFVIFIFILQQFDGNILEPQILGSQTGLASFWVMFAILVGGGLFGFLGMVLGVPVFAVIYAYFCYFIDKRLQKKGLPVSAADYKDAYRYEGTSPTAVFYPGKEKNNKKNNKRWNGEPVENIGDLMKLALVNQEKKKEAREASRKAYEAKLAARKSGHDMLRAEIAAKRKGKGGGNGTGPDSKDDVNPGSGDSGNGSGAGPDGSEGSGGRTGIGPDGNGYNGGNTGSSTGGGPNGNGKTDGEPNGNGKSGGGPNGNGKTDGELNGDGKTDGGLSNGGADADE